MQSNDARILRGAAIVAAPVGLVAAVVSAFVSGQKGLIGGLVAVAVVAVFFGLASAALMRITEDSPQLAMTAGLLVYTVQILLIGVFIVIFRDTTLFDGRAFGFSLLATALAWVGGQVKHSLTSKMLYVQPEPSVPPTPPGKGSGTSEAASGAADQGAAGTAGEGDAQAGKTAEGDAADPVSAESRDAA